MEEKAALVTRESGEAVAVLRVGDLCVSSSLSKLMGVFRDFEVVIIPAVGSVQFSAAAAQICIDEALVVSFHDGRENLKASKLKLMTDYFRAGRHLIILTNETQMPHQTARYLIDSGISEQSTVVVCEHLTMTDEKVFEGKLGEVPDKLFRPTSVMVVRHGSAQGLIPNSRRKAILAPGAADSESVS